MAATTSIKPQGPQPTEFDEEFDDNKKIQTRLCQLWQILLPVDTAEPHDNFFLCGGDSLLAIRLCYCIGKELSVDAQVALLFQYPTVAELAPKLTRQLSLIPARGLNFVPMSSTQQRLWFIQQYQQGISTCHASLLLQLVSASEGQQLTSALQLLVVRHQALRTRFF